MNNRNNGPTILERKDSLEYPIVAVMDLDTGEVVVNDHYQIYYASWSEGNWSCDCNRVMEFGLDHTDECESKRFVVVDVMGLMDTYPNAEFIKDCNSDYPDWINRMMAHLGDTAQEAFKKRYPELFTGIQTVDV